MTLAFIFTIADFFNQQYLRLWLLTNEFEIIFFVEEVKAEGVKVDNILGFNGKAFIIGYLCFTRDFFSLFYFHCFFNTSFVNQQYSFSLVKVANS